MKFRFVNKTLIDEINVFLNSPNPKLIKMADEKNTPDEEKRNFVRSVINHLPKLQSDYNESRDFYNNNYYIYNPMANMFRTFRMTNFNNGLNDNKELEWFGEYVKSAASKSTYLKKPILSVVPTLKSMAADGYFLIKCVTTTDVNERYMVGNYCDANATQLNFCPINSDYTKQFRARFNPLEINGKYDALVSPGMIPVRGFVRYNKAGKENVIAFLNDYIADHGMSASDPEVVFVMSVLSIFIKGIDMSVEAEYRFVVIGDTKNVADIDIPAKVDWSQSWYHDSTLMKNPLYCPITPLPIAMKWHGRNN